MMPKRIEVQDLTVAYGEIVAVTDLTMRVEAGEIVALLGANGAGKSSTLKAIMGTVRPARGTISLNGHDVTGQPAHAAAESWSRVGAGGPPDFQSDDRP